MVRRKLMLVTIWTKRLKLLKEIISNAANTKEGTDGQTL